MLHKGHPKALLPCVSVRSLVTELCVPDAGSSVYKHQMHTAFSLREMYYWRFLKCFCSRLGRICLFLCGNMCDKAMVIFPLSKWKYTPFKLHSPGLDFKVNIFRAIQSHKTLQSLWRCYLCCIHNFEQLLFGISIVNIVLFAFFFSLSYHPWGRVIDYAFTSRPFFS